MFQPIINQVGPALIEQGYRSAANNELAGAQSLAAGISQAGQSVGKGIGDAVSTFYQRAQQMNATAGKMAALSNSGLLPQEYIDKMAAEKDPDKLRGQVEFMTDMANNQMAQNRQIAVAGAKHPDWSPEMVDLGNGQFALKTSPASAQLVKPDAPATKPAVKYLPTDTGYVAVDASNPSQGVPVTLPGGGAAVPAGKVKPDQSRQALITGIDTAMGDLGGKIAKGQTSDTVAGLPSWLAIGSWPLAIANKMQTSYADQLKDLQAQRDALAKGGARPGVAAVAPQAAATPALSAGVDRAAALQQAQQAIANGANPDAVKARLQQMGVQ